MKIRVLKRITNNGIALNAGEIIDATGWRNIKTLVSGRYVEILDEPTEQPKPKEAETKTLVSDTAKPKAKTTAKIAETK